MEPTGTVQVIGWMPLNGGNVPVPAPGTPSAEQTVKFTLSGTGAIKFRAAIITCNGQSCKNQNWILDPESKDTDSVDFP